MSDAYVPISFVADELLTSTKMNQLAADLSYFHDGTGLGDGIILTRHLADSVYTLLGDFSTDEAATPFKWIDGKTIYKKTVDIAPLPNTTDKTVAHGITNISNIISVSGCALATSGSSFPLPFASYVANQGVDVYANTTNIVAGAGIDRSSFTTAYVTLLYTKTS